MSASSSSLGSLETLRNNRFVGAFRTVPEAFPSFVIDLLLVVSDNAFRFLEAGCVSFDPFGGFICLTAKATVDLVVKIVLRFLDSLVVPARSPVTGLTFSLSTGKGSFEAEEPWGILFRRADERVAMTREVAGLAFTASGEGTSWKTVKAREAMLAVR